MSLNTLSRNNTLVIKNKKFFVERNRVSAQQVILVEEKTGVELTMTYAEISSKFSLNELQFDQSTQDSLEENGFDTTDRKWLLLPDEKKDILWRKKGYADSISDENGQIIKGSKSQQEAIYGYAKNHDKYREELGIPSLSAVRRWFKKLKNAMGNLLALLRRPPTPSKTNPKSVEKRAQEERNRELFYYIIDEYYMKQKDLKVPQLPKKMHTAIKTIARFENCTVPSLATLYRWIKDLPEYEKVAKKKGWLHAKREFPSGAPILEPTYIMEAVELDHTQLDINVIDPDSGESIGRPWLTVFLEKKSRMVLGFYLTMSNPSARSVLKAFRHAILSKDYVKQNFGDFIVSEWPCMGMPEQVITDNGRDLHASEVQRVLTTFSDVVYLPKGSPQLKGRVERFFKTLNESLLHSLDGTTFSNYIKCADYDSEGNAIYTLSDINMMIHKWIVDEYHIETHRSLGMSPLSYWKLNTADMMPIRLPGSVTEIDELLWTPENKTLQKDGISIHSLKYKSPELMAIARQHGFGVRLDFFLDPEDLSVIRVVVPSSNSTIDVPCTLTKYVSERITLKEHKAIKAAANKRRADDEKLNEALLLSVREWMEEMEKKAKAAKTKVARKGGKKVAKERAGDSESLNGTKAKTMGQKSHNKVDAAIPKKDLSQIKKKEVKHAA